MWVEMGEAAAGHKGDKGVVTVRGEGEDPKEVFLTDDLGMVEEGALEVHTVREGEDEGVSRELED